MRVVRARAMYVRRLIEEDSEHGVKRAVKGSLFSCRFVGAREESREYKIPSQGRDETSALHLQPSVLLEGNRSKPVSRTEIFYFFPLPQRWRIADYRKILHMWHIQSTVTD
jgi:hypothetical protein